MTVTVKTEDAVSTVLTAARAAAAELTSSVPDHRNLVGWLSRHAAAFEHAVLPVAQRELSPDAVASQVQRVRRHEHLLLQLHQTIYGDGRGTAVELGHALQHLDVVLSEHIAGTRALLAGLAGALTDQEWSALVERYDHAFRNAPTRPHPHTPHGRLGERLAFPVAGAVDRLLDALDSRVVPAPPDQRAAEVSAPHQT
jgi:hypothetical protein